MTRLLKCSESLSDDSVNRTVLRSHDILINFSLSFVTFAVNRHETRYGCHATWGHYNAAFNTARTPSRMEYKQRARLVLGGTWFKSQMRHRLYRQKFLVAFFSQHGRKPELLEIGHIWLWHISVISRSVKLCWVHMPPWGKFPV